MIAFLAWLVFAIETAPAVTAVTVVLRAPPHPTLQPAPSAEGHADGHGGATHPVPRPLPGRPAPGLSASRVIRGEIEPRHHGAAARVSVGLPAGAFGVYPVPAWLDQAHQGQAQLRPPVEPGQVRE
jgi:hypothetical protein